MSKLAPYRKAVTIVLGAAATLVAAYAPHYATVVQAAILVATAYGVYAVPNAKKRAKN